MQRFKICIEIDKDTLLALGAATEIHGQSADEYVTALVRKDLMEDGMDK